MEIQVIKDMEKNYEERIRIGSLIAELRKKRGLSTAQLAEKSGIDKSNLIKIEHGRYSVGLDILAKIAGALSAEIDLVTK